MANPPTTLLREHCNQCLGQTKHTLVAMKRVSSTSEEDSFTVEWGTTYRMLQCRGCDAVLLKAEHWHSDYDMSSETEYYPPRLARRPPAWMWQLPDEWRFLLREIYAALQADSKRLAIMGARALVDLYINDTVGDIQGFKQRLAALVSHGYLVSGDRDTLNAALEAGQFAEQNGLALKQQDVSHVMDIIENLLQRKTLKSSADALLKGMAESCTDKK